MKAFGFFILNVAAMASIAANGQTESSPAVQGDPAAAQEIRGWIDHWRKAVSAKDVDRVMELYTEDVVATTLCRRCSTSGRPPIARIGNNSSTSTTAIFMSRRAICAWGLTASSVTRPDYK